MYPIFHDEPAGEDNASPRRRNDISFIVVDADASARHLKRLAQVHLLPAFGATSLNFAPASGFEGKPGQTLHSLQRMPGGIFDVVAFGLGERDKLNLSVWQSALASACKAVKSFSVSDVSLVMPELRSGRKHVFGSASLQEIGRLTGQAIITTLHEPLHYKTEVGGHKESKRVGRVVLRCKGLTPRQQAELLTGLEKGRMIAVSINMARDLGDMPANFCNPDHIMAVARRIGYDFPSTVKVTVLDCKQAESCGMNKFLAVAAGSKEEPKVAIVEYTPAKFNNDSPVLGYVGKTVTFDTGGVDIKPAGGMRDMKYDMCGGADVLAAIRAIAALGLPIRVKAFVAATTNRTGSSAYLPGDVIPAGIFPKSVEVDNTDAEGRLTLVDAISLAKRDYGVTHIVDYATLTGAVITALGDACAGVVTNNQTWCDKYLAAAKAAGEDAHQLPLLAKYKKQNDSKVADLKNSGGSKAGAITAGAFVLEAAFDTPTTHVDIAGTAGIGEGASGWGVATLVKLAETLAHE